MSESQDKNQMQVIINLDTTPVLYTDGVQISANEDGVVLDVMQKVGNTNQQRVVTRVGMSLSHARKLADLLMKVANNPTGMVRTRAVKAD